MTTGGDWSPPPLPGRQITMLPAASVLVDRPRTEAKSSRNACTLGSGSDGCQQRTLPRLHVLSDKCKHKVFLSQPAKQARPNHFGCPETYFCSCLDGRGSSASFPKYFQSAAGSSPCRAGYGSAIISTVEVAVLRARRGDCFSAKPKPGAKVDLE